MSAQVIEQSALARGTRLVFVDNIRTVVIVQVIWIHAAVTYSHVGSWYYLDGPEPKLASKLAFATFETFSQAYFMGFLFFLAGYFVPPAFDSKGVGRFLRERALRLGIPSLFYMLVIHPYVVYDLLRRFYDPARPTVAAAYGRYIASGRVLSGSGPMWFAVALLIFCAGYAGVRVFVGPTETPGVPNHKSVVAVMAAIAGASFMVRTVQPIGTNVYNMQLCYFSQYIALFVLGTLAYRGDWLRRIPYGFGMFWCKLALIIGVPSWGILLAVSGVAKGNQALLGGLSWQSALFSAWESFFCVGVCLGLIVLFRERFNYQTKFSAWASRNSFAVYLFHTPILIATTLALRPIAVNKGWKFAIAALLAVPITFAISGFLRPRLPGLKKVL